MELLTLDLMGFFGNQMFLPDPEIKFDPVDFSNPVKYHNHITNSGLI